MKSPYKYLNFVSFETSMKMKELGYNEETLASYRIDDRSIVYDTPWNANKSSWAVGSPTLYEASNWLRDEYGVHILIIPTVTSFWTYKTVSVITNTTEIEVSDEPPYNDVCGYDFNTHDEALQEAITEIIEQIIEETNE